MEIAIVPKTSHASQYPGVYLYTGAGRMMRPVFNIKLGGLEYIGMYVLEKNKIPSISSRGVLYLFGNPRFRVVWGILKE